jgi:hypothetical protein
MVRLLDHVQPRHLRHRPSVAERARNRFLLAAVRLACRCAPVLGGACTSQPAATQVLVTVNSDLRAGSELAEVRVATDAHELTFYVLPSSHPGGLRTKLPFSFRLVPPNGDASKSVDLEVEGYDSQQALRVRRRVRVGFIPHQTRLLALSLTHDCEARFLDCEAKAQTCDRGDCKGVLIDVETLPSVKPGKELDGIVTLPAWCSTSMCMDAGETLFDATGGMDTSRDGAADGQVITSTPEGGGRDAGQPSCPASEGVFDPVYTLVSGNCGPIEDPDHIVLDGAATGTSTIIEKRPTTTVRTEIAQNGCSVHMTQTVTDIMSPAQQRIEGSALAIVDGGSRITGMVQLMRSDANGQATCSGTYVATFTKAQRSLAPGP